MRFWLLSHLEGSPGNRLVLEAAARAGHEARLVHPGHLSVVIDGGGGAPRVLDGDGPASLPELVFTRLGSSASAAALDTLDVLERCGVPCVNHAAALRQTRDKARAFVALAAAGLPLPPTVLLGRDTSAKAAAERLGPPPWVVKLPHGTQGMAVTQVGSLPALRSLVDMLRGLEQRIVLQHLIPEAKGVDVRVLVLGGRAVAAMRRTAQGDEWRSNLHRGGQAVAEALTPELREVAERSAAALGLEVAGVDLLPSEPGPVVCEVNGSPGLEGLEQATGRDLASELVATLAARLGP